MASAKIFTCATNQSEPARRTATTLRTRWSRCVRAIDLYLLPLRRQLLNLAGKPEKTIAISNTKETVISDRNIRIFPTVIPGGRWPTYSSNAHTVYDDGGKAAA